MGIFGRRRAADPAVLAVHLADGVQQLADGKLGRARRSFRGVLDDAERMQSADPAIVDPLRGAALVALGDIATQLGRSAEALESYRAAAAMIELRPQVWRVLAEDVARRRDVTPEAVRDLVGFFGVHGDVAGPDQVVDFVRICCLPDPTADLEAVRFAEHLAARISDVAPGLGWVHAARGSALSRLDRTTEAVVVLTEAERLDPAFSGIPYLLGWLYRHTADEDRAYEAFRRALALDGTLLDVIEELSWICLARAGSEASDRSGQHLDEAIDLLKTACGLQPGRADLWHRLALATRRRDPVAAREPFTAAARLDPTNVSYHRDRADLMLELGDVAESIASLRAALTVIPTDAVLNVRLGGLLVECGHDEEAERALRVAIQADPAHRGAPLLLARSLFAQRKFDATAVALAGVQDRSVEESHLLGRSHARAGRLDEAARELAGRADADAGVARTLGCVHARRGAWTDAVTSFDRAREADDESPDLHLFAGVARHRAGDHSGAREDLDRAMELAPDDPRVHNALGALAVDQDDPGAAKAAFTRALAVAPGDLRAHIGMGVTLERLDAPDRAVDHYNRGLGERADWRPARLRLAAIAIRRDEPGEAVRILRPMGRGDAAVDGLLALALARDANDEGAHELWSSLRGDADADGVLRENLRLSADHIAHAAMIRRDFDMAGTAWMRCRRFAPDDERYPAAVAEAWLLAASAALDTAPDAVALQVAHQRLDQAAELVPQDPRPPYLRALVAILDGRVSEAVKLLSPHVEGGDVDAAYHRALALAGAGLLDDADRQLAGIAGDRARFGAQYDLLRGTIHAHRGGWPDALAAYRAALIPSEDDDECRTVAYAAITRSALEAGELSAAVDALMPFESTSPAARRLLGLAHAEQGDLDAALEYLPSASNADGTEPVARVLLLRAGKRAARGDHASAARDVIDAAAADPGWPAAESALALVPEWRALAHVRAGRHADALSIWEERATQNPMDLVAIHHMAVLTYQMIMHADPGPRGAGELSSLLIASWGSVLESPAFWARLGRRTGRPVTGDDRAATRQRFAEQMTRKLRDLGPSGLTTAEAPHVLWGLELRAAAAVAQFVPARHVGGWQAGFSCGPLMLGRIGATSPEWSSLVNGLRAAAARSSDEAGRRVHTLLSPLGRCRYLLDDGLLDAAVGELSRLASIPSAQELMAEALLAQAVARAEDGLWEAAVDGFVRGAGAGAALAPRADLVRDAVAQRVKQLLDDDDYQGVVELMESVHPLLPPDPGFDADLAASYAQLARQVNNTDDYDGAVALLRKALALKPEDANTRHFASVAMGNLARKLIGESAASRKRAVALLREASSYDDGGAKGTSRASNTSGLLFNTASKLADKKEYADAVSLLREALTYEDDGITWRLIGGVYRQWGRPDDALAALTTGFERHPDDVKMRNELAVALHNRGVRLADAGKHEDALASFTKARSVNDSAGTREQMGQTYFLRALRKVKSGDRYGARKDIEKAVQLNPSDSQLRDALRALS